MKTLKEIGEETAKELKLPIKLVESILNSYWSEIKEEFDDPERDNIRLDYLGTFYIDPKKTMKRVTLFFNTLKNYKRTKYKLESKHITEILFRDRWKLKNRFGFRLTDKTWKYVNMNVGYVRNLFNKEESDND